MATIIKRGNSYQFKAYGVDLYGQPCRKTTTWTPEPNLTPRQAQKAAERAAAMFEEECKRGRVLDGNSKLNDYYALQWREQRAVNLSPKTIADYDLIWKRIEAHKIGRTPLKNITPPLINGFYKYLIEKATSAHTGKPLSPVTIHGYHRVLSSVLNGAVKDGHISDNPCRNAEPPRLPQNEAHTVQPERMESIITALGNEPLLFRVFMLIGIYTGARRNELCGLTWDKWNPDTGTITIDQSLQQIERQGPALGPTKTRSSRTVRVPQSIAPLIEEWRTEQMSWQAAVGDEWGTAVNRKYSTVTNSAPDTPWMFTDSHGFPRSPNGFLKSFRQFLKRSGAFTAEEIKAGEIEKINIHSLRHSSASVLIGKGVNLATVANRLGHANTATTMKVYTHAIKRLNDVAADVLEDAYSLKE